MTKTEQTRFQARRSKVLQQAGESSARNVASTCDGLVQNLNRNCASTRRLPAPGAAEYVSASELAVPKEDEARLPLGVARFVRFNRFRIRTESVTLYRFSGAAPPDVAPLLDAVLVLGLEPKPKVLFKRRFTVKYSGADP